MPGLLLSYTFSLYVLQLLGTQVMGQQTTFSYHHHDLCPSRPPWLTLPVPNPTKSFWIDTPNANPLAHEGSTGPLGFDDEDVDVCIIGSGITGISALYHLQRQLEAIGNPRGGAKVVVLEAREFCSGATGRNGGHLTPEPFNGYTARVRSYGKENANKSYLLEEYVSSSIVDIVQKHELTSAIDLVKGGHVTLFLTEEEQLLALQDYNDAKEGGMHLQEVKFLDRKEVLETYGVNATGVFYGSYNLWPLKFVSNLYNISSSKSSQNFKLKLHTLTPVTSINPSSPPGLTAANTRWIVTTPRGMLACKTIIHATNGYASYLLPHLQSIIIPARGQVVALRAKSSLDRLHRRSWRANWGFEYWFARPEDQTADGQGYQPPLVILGGGRDTAGPGLEQHTVDDGVLNKRVGKTLKEFLPHLFEGTGLFEEGRAPEMEWTGIMGYTPDGVPLVGPLKGLEGQYIAAGFTGHGMPRAYAAAEVVAGMIAAKLTGTEWEMPTWLPEHYLTTWKH